jgi:sorting nexin-1/2
VKTKDLENRARHLIIIIINNKKIMMAIDPNAELFDGPDGGPSPPSLPTSAPPASAPPTVDETNNFSQGRGGGGTLHLSITDPQQIGEGRNAHTFYRIDVRPNKYAEPIASVRRRYSDFRWLFTRLHEERPGAIIPIIPHTNAFQLEKRLSEEIIEGRRNRCEKFLRMVQVHPELEGCPSIAAFFNPDAEVFEQTKKDHPEMDGIVDYETSANSTKEKVKHFFVKAGIKAKVARGGIEQLEDTPDAAQMEEVEQYLSTLEIHIKALVKATLYLVDVSKDTSANLHDLGQTLFGMHQTYDPDAPSTDNNSANQTKSKNPSLKTISNIFASLSAIQKVKYDDNYSKVSTPILDLQEKIKAARLALKRRRDHAITYNTFLQQIKNRQAALEKLNHKNATHPHSPQMEHQIVTAQQLLDESNKSSRLALAALEKVTQRVFREMDRFKHSVDADLRLVYVNHARVQVDYARQLDVEWNKLLPNGSGDESGVGRAGSSNSVDDELSKEADMMMI